jgi:rubrerythrin
MIRNPIDIASRVSPELCSFIETIIDKLQTDDPVTLGAIRAFIANDLPAEISESEEMHHFDVQESLVDELDELIEGFGESAAAVDFTSATVSEPLSRVIEEIINDENREYPATLEEVREAILNGISSRLVGDGVLDEEDDDQLLPEIENLIERYGNDAMAEEYLRYE